MSTNTNIAAPRLKLIDPETTSKPLKEAFAFLPVINVFRAMANAETLYPYFGNYLLQLFRPMELDKALERMIVLHVAKRSDCLYAWPKRGCGTVSELLMSRSSLFRRGTSRRIALAKPSRAPSPSRMK